MKSLAGESVLTTYMDHRRGYKRSFFFFFSLSQSLSFYFIFRISSGHIGYSQLHSSILCHSSSSKSLIMGYTIRAGARSCSHVLFHSERLAKRQESDTWSQFANTVAEPPDRVIFLHSETIY